MRVSDLASLLDMPAGELAEQASVLHTGEPVVLSPTGNVDRETADSLADVLLRIPSPTVLVGDPDRLSALATVVDVSLTSVPKPPRPWVCADAQELSDVVRRRPLAALSLVVLLRNTGGLDTWSALAEESATYAMLLGSGAFKEWLARRGAPRYRRPQRVPVRSERIDDVLYLTVDRPEARNAFDTLTRDAFVDALRLAEAEPSLKVEIRGNGPCFSAGGDLEEFGSVGDPATAHAVRLTRHPGAALHAVSTRTTCYVHGPCVGAGVELPAFAARVLADDGTTFTLPEVSMGLIPGAGGTVSVPHRIGRQRAAWLALTGATIDSETALAWGLVDGTQVGGDRHSIGRGTVAR